MWIQVRTIDGTETQTIDDLSRLTKIECLREKIQETFRVSPDRQRLFYRGKQLEDGHTLFDYNVGLNDIVQLLIRSESEAPTTASVTDQDGQVNSCAVSNCKNKVKKTSSGSPSQPSTSSRSFLIDPGIGLYKINELVDARDVSIGAWFEAHIENVTRATKGHKNGKAQGKSGNTYKRTNGNLSQDHSRENANNLDSTPSTSYSDCMDTDEEAIYHIKYDEYPENGIVEMDTTNLRPRARTILKWSELKVGDVVMVNYNVETPEERGFWFDAEITSLREISRTNKEVHAKILLGLREVGSWVVSPQMPCSSVVRTTLLTQFSIQRHQPSLLTRGPEDTINDCKILFIEEMYKIEKPGAYPLTFGDGDYKRKSGPECKHCRADPDKECRFCSCYLCGGKQDAHMQLLCDECNMAYHIYCLNPPLSKIPEDEDWYCPSCKNDSNEVVKAGEKLKQSKKKAKMPSASTESQRDWGKGMACVGRTKECTIVPSNHYGPIPGVPVGTTWKFRVQVSEAGVHRPHVGGIHGRSNDGAYSLVLAGGFEDEVDRGDEFTYTGSGGRDLSGNKRIGEHSFDQTLTHMNRALALNCDAPLDDKNGAESKNWRAGKPVRVVRSSKGRRISKYAPEEGNRYDGIYKVVKYWPEIGKCGFLVWRYLLRRDDVEPAPWTSEGMERSKKLGLSVQYPEGYLEAMASREKKDKVKKQAVKHEPTSQSNGNQKRTIHDAGIEEPTNTPKAMRMGDGGKGEAFQLTQEQQWLIREDCMNQKLWDEVLASLKEGPNFLKKLEQSFMCVCCQELVYQPVTTECLHNVCKSCLQRSFRAEVFTCPACRYDLGKGYTMVPNKILQTLLDQFFPGYSKGR
ncbi:E3 ubiquitin-protein ligase UHRF2 isoform X1 [Falco biarmicus]|uniref:E3 ubiquitin-protein ligase UHRF2 isoform X1 n=1 Tax=Falco rusticolus TaxID=120794 RepID=UPI00188683AF|nr:E3 ubiquitin-protein ligase UHRF2 isoform X1 [Falco rusticolus]XP_055554578.1 E3 ubiquitin-protein ligase UHRF2 isoform X1 [Falco cherrug]XP_055646489.1 E3 ubiquitin-protein ligase UHRF2 isoform X1 [Falco peregrinus]XP_056181114.1 E3 ubiquitin-protein ligase UHRF2 isoform X1 [Falco biarmicus]